MDAFRLTHRLVPPIVETPIARRERTRVAESILQRIADGDDRAVKECLDRYANLVWSVARRMSPSPADAEDAVQEIFVELWKSAGRFDPERASEPAFITMIARRRMIDRLRHNERRPQTSPMPEDFDFAGDQHEQLELGAEASLAMRALDVLKPEQREAVVLSVVHGMSHSEVAERTNLPLGTVKSFIRRGLNAVRDSLAAREPGEEASS
jgi:RNA polymerase sigma factor (sigma-70 family)